MNYPWENRKSCAVSRSSVLERKGWICISVGALIIAVALIIMARGG